MSASIEHYVEPVYLYRYRSLDEIDRELDAIKSAYIWGADYTQMNDPMEGLFRSGTAFKTSPDYEAVTSDIANAKLNIGLAAFSEVKNHELMWAHYTDQFRGICVEYKFSELLKKMTGKVEFIRLFYNDRLPYIGEAPRTPEKIAKRILSHKNYRWLYEREWRMFGAKEKNVYEDSSCVTCVYVGNRIQNVHLVEIVKVLGGLGIKMKYMKINGYSVSFGTKPERYL